MRNNSPRSIGIMIPKSSHLICLWCYKIETHSIPEPLNQFCYKNENKVLPQVSNDSSSTRNEDLYSKHHYLFTNARNMLQSVYIFCQEPASVFVEEQPRSIHCNTWQCTRHNKYYHINLHKPFIEAINIYNIKTKRIASLWSMVSFAFQSSGVTNFCHRKVSSNKNKLIDAPSSPHNPQTLVDGP